MHVQSKWDRSKDHQISLSNPPYVHIVLTFAFEFTLRGKENKLCRSVVIATYALK